MEEADEAVELVERVAALHRIELFARAGTNDEGRWEVTTRTAPHINVSVFARGLLNRVVTRIYFDGEPANETDPLLACVPEERRATIVSKPDASGVYQWNVILQGTDAETVFFDY